MRPAGVNCGVPRRLGAAEAGGGSAPTPAHSAFEWAAAFEPRVTDWRSAAGRWTRPRCTSDSREEGASPLSKTSLFFKNSIYLCIYLFVHLVTVCTRSFAAVARGGRSEDNSWESLLACQPVGPRNRTHTDQAWQQEVFNLTPPRPLHLPPKAFTLYKQSHTALVDQEKLPGS